MKKIICDRCGKEIDTLAQGIQGLDIIAKSLNAATMIKSVNYNITSYGGGSTFHRSYDLCKDCQNDLDNWLNCDREEEKHSPATITREAAIDRLHELGWLQKHDKELTETNIRIGYDAAIMERASIAEVIEQVRREHKEENNV